MASLQVLALLVLQITSVQLVMVNRDLEPLPRQMKRLYRQYKHGMLSDNGINTVRYIQPLQGSITSNGNLLYNLDSIHKQETVVKAELHFYRKLNGSGVPLLIKLSEISPYYLTTVQQNEINTKVKGWITLNVTTTLQMCVNTLKTNYQLGVAFNWKNANKDSVNMDQFLRHHSLPFLLVYSNDTWSLDMDQIRSSDNSEQLLEEMNQMIDPKTGRKVKDSLKKLNKRDVSDNGLPLDSTEIERQKSADREMNKINLNLPRRYNSGDLDFLLTNLIDENVEPFATTALPMLNKQSSLPKLDDKESNNKEMKTSISKPRKNKMRKKNRKNKKRKLPWPKHNRFESDNKQTQQVPAYMVSSQTVSNARGLCSRRRLRVNFEDIGWGKKIIEPKSYEAYYCSGQCSYPYSFGLKTSNHATLQSLIHSINSQEVPQPCCVPEKLSSLLMLFYDEQNNIVLKNYPKMSVDECACR